MSVTAGSTPRLGRVGAWMGIVFAPLFIVGEFISPSPSNSKSTQEWARLFLSSSHRTAAIVGAYMAVFGLLAFLWFRVAVAQPSG